MGYKPPYFSQVVKGDAPTGDTFIDKMCSAFGFTFIPSSALSDSATSAPSQEAALGKMVEQLLDQADRSAAREQVRDNLMNAMYEQLRANGVKLDGLKELMDQLKSEGV